MRQTALFAGIFLVGSSVFAADSQLMNLVMPDAQAMAGVNVTTAAISPFGQYVLSRVGSNDAGLQAMITATGFDPRHDVTEILVASNGNLTTQSGLVLAKGNFKVDQITAAISQESKFVVGTYKGATLISSTDPLMSHGVAFIGSSIALAGDLASVKAALDRSAGVNSVSPQLAAQVQTLSSTEDAWSVSLASLAALIPNIGENSAKGPAAQTLQLVKNIQSSSGGVKFGTNVQITGQAVADTPQNATALADIVRMVTSLASMGAAGQGGEAAAAAQLLQNLQVSTSGSAVNLAMSIPETDIEALLKTASGHAAGNGAAAKRRQL